MRQVQLRKTYQTLSNIVNIVKHCQTYSYIFLNIVKNSQAFSNILNHFQTLPNNFKYLVNMQQFSQKLSAIEELQKKITNTYS